MKIYGHRYSQEKCHKKLGMLGLGRVKILGYNYPCVHHIVKVHAQLRLKTKINVQKSYILYMNT